MQGTDEDDIERAIRGALRGEVGKRGGPGENRASNSANSANHGVSVAGNNNQVVFGWPPQPPPRRRRAWLAAWSAMTLALFLGHVVATLDWAARTPGAAPVHQAFDLLQGGSPADVLRSALVAAAASTALTATAAGISWLRRRRR